MTATQGAHTATTATPTRHARQLVSGAAWDPSLTPRNSVTTTAAPLRSGLRRCPDERPRGVPVRVCWRREIRRTPTMTPRVTRWRVEGVDPTGVFVTWEQDYDDNSLRDVTDCLISG